MKKKYSKRCGIRPEKCKHKCSGISPSGCKIYNDRNNCKKSNQHIKRCTQKSRNHPHNSIAYRFLSINN